MDENQAWISLLPSFGIFFTCGVLQYASSLIRQNLIENAASSSADDTSLSFIAWISSIYVGAYNLLGPISSLMVYKMGCRMTVFIGGTLETLGFICSFWVNDIRLLLFTYSFLSGMGAGISLPVASVQLGYNFDRYLSTASGIALTGIGIGFIVMPSLVRFLLNNYGLQGTFLIMAGITLHKWLWAALMKPSAFELEHLNRFRKSKKNKNISLEMEMEISVLEPLKNSTLQDDLLQENCPDLLFKRKTQQSNGDASFSSQNSKNKTTPFCNGFPPNETFEKNADKMAATSNEMELPFFPHSRKQQNNQIANNWDKHFKNPGKERTNNEIKTLKLLEPKSSAANIISNTSNVSDLPNSDIRTLQSLEPKSSAANIIRNTSNVSDQPTDGATSSNLFRSSYKPCIDVITNTRFLLFLFSILSFTVPETLIYLMIPTYFSSKGSTDSEISTLFTILGVFSTLTRPLMGFLDSSKMADISLLVSSPISLLGIITIILPFFVHSFGARVLFVIAFGLYNCSIYALLNRILVKICGLYNLPAAFGILLLVKGIAAIFGPPITILLTNSTESVFFVAGVMYGLCSFAVLFVGGEEKKSTSDLL